MDQWISYSVCGQLELEPVSRTETRCAIIKGVQRYMWPAKICQDVLKWAKLLLREGFVKGFSENVENSGFKHKTSKKHFMHFYPFLAAMSSSIHGHVCPSVCLSVCLVTCWNCDPCWLLLAIADLRLTLLTLDWPYWPWSDLGLTLDWPLIDLVDLQQTLLILDWFFCP